MLINFIIIGIFLIAFSLIFFRLSGIFKVKSKTLVWSKLLTKQTVKQGITYEIVELYHIVYKSKREVWKIKIIKS